jgi:hypothetical protein
MHASYLPITPWFVVPTCFFMFWYLYFYEESMDKDNRFMMMLCSEFGDMVG